MQRIEVQDDEDAALHGLDRLAHFFVKVKVNEELLELHTHVHQRRGEEVDGEFLVGHELNGAVYGTLVLGVSTLNLQQTSDGRLEVGLGRRGGREGRRRRCRGERGVCGAGLP